MIEEESSADATTPEIHAILDEADAIDNISAEAARALSDELDKEELQQEAAAKTVESTSGITSQDATPDATAEAATTTTKVSESNGHVESTSKVAIPATATVVEISSSSASPSPSAEPTPARPSVTNEEKRSPAPKATIFTDQQFKQLLECVPFIMKVPEEKWDAAWEGFVPVVSPLLDRYDGHRCESRLTRVICVG